MLAIYHTNCSMDQKVWMGATNSKYMERVKKKGERRTEGKEKREKDRGKGKEGMMERERKKGLDG
jgi:hypothetical protein